jgi:hypothetical protein
MAGSNPASESAPSPPKKRRWLQFSLRALLILTTLCAIGLGWFAQVARRYAARQRMEQMGVRVEIQPGPEWISRWLGQRVSAYFDDVTAIECPYAWDALTSGDVNSTLLKDGGLQTKLRRLDLTSVYEANDDGLARLSELDCLEELLLDGTYVSDAGLRHLAGMNRLRKLSLFAAYGVTGRGLGHLSSLSLEELDLGDTDVHDQYSPALGQLWQLRRLSLVHTQVGDEGLANLAGLANLEYLNLSGTKVTSDGLRHLASATNLKELFLAGTKIDDGGITHVSVLPQLRVLSLAGTKVSDQCLELLSSLNSLEELILVGCDIGPKSVSDFSARKPQIRVHQ